MFLPATTSRAPVENQTPPRYRVRDILGTSRPPNFGAHPTTGPGLSTVKTRFLLPALLLAAMSAARLSAAFNPSSPLFSRLAGPVIVPAEVSDRALFVNVTINGRGPFRMMVDTGSSVTVLTPACATAVDARPEDADRAPPDSINGFNDETDVQSVLLRTLEIGGARFEGVTAGVSSDLVAAARTADQRFDGLLGFSLFADVVVALDFPGQRLVLDTAFPKNLPPVRAELAVREIREVPLVTARLQGRDVEILVDTGSNAGLQIPRDLARGASWKAEPRAGPLVSVIGGTGRELLGRLAGEFHLDRVTQTEPVVAIAGGTASVGVAFLRHFCVVFDPSHDKLWLCASSDANVPAPPARSVGLSLLADEDGWRVAGTIPGSPAEGAGIAAGDLVTQIEGKPAAAWSRDQIDRWADQHSEIALRVARNSDHRDLSLSVWALVP